MKVLPPDSHTPSRGTALSLPLAEHTLDDLLLLKKEGAEDALTDTLGAARAAVRTRDVLLALGQTVQHRRTHTRDARKRAAAVAAAHGLRGLADVLEGQLAARNADRLALVAAGLVRAAATVGETLDHCSNNNKNTTNKTRKKVTNKKNTAFSIFFFIFFFYSFQYNQRICKSSIQKDDIILLHQIMTSHL